MELLRAVSRKNRSFSAKMPDRMLLNAEFCGKMGQMWKL
jgi:hypothetical protein